MTSLLTVFGRVVAVGRAAPAVTVGVIVTVTTESGPLAPPPHALNRVAAAARQSPATARGVAAHRIIKELPIMGRDPCSRGRGDDRHARRHSLTSVLSSHVLEGPQEV